MATLTYTSEQKGFRYEDAEYVLSGTKTSGMDGAIQSVDGGSITKGGDYLGSFYIRYEGDVPRVSTSDIPMEEMVTVFGLIQALEVALEGPTEA